MFSAFASYRCVCFELQSNGIPFECEKRIAIFYRGTPVGFHKIDLVVWEDVIVELKAVRALNEVHTAQMLSYLRASGLRIGLLMNFNEATLKAGLRRVVL